MAQLKMSAEKFVEAIKNGDDLPDGIVVDGDVNLGGYKGNISLPNNLTITKGLYLYNTNITELPQGLCCEVLDIGRCKKITSIPNDIKVKDLFASFSSLTCIPQRFTCERLYIGGCDITEFPDNLTISKELCYGPNPIHNIPQNLTLPPDDNIVYFSK